MREELYSISILMGSLKLRPEKFKATPAWFKPPSSIWISTGAIVSSPVRLVESGMLIEALNGIESTVKLNDVLAPALAFINFLIPRRILAEVLLLLRASLTVRGSLTRVP